jgi:hypothetical protein
MDTQERHMVWSRVGVYGWCLRGKEGNIDNQKRVGGSRMGVCCIACKEVFEN